MNRFVKNEGANEIFLINPWCDFSEPRVVPVSGIFSPLRWGEGETRRNPIPSTVLCLRTQNVLLKATRTSKEKT